MAQVVLLVPELGLASDRGMTLWVVSQIAFGNNPSFLHPAQPPAPRLRQLPW